MKRFFQINTYDRNISVAKQQMWRYPIHITTFVQRLEFDLTVNCEQSKLQKTRTSQRHAIQLKFTFIICSTQRSHPFSFDASNFTQSAIAQWSNLRRKAHFCYFIKVNIFLFFFFNLFLGFRFFIG